MVSTGHAVGKKRISIIDPSIPTERVAQPKESKNGEMRKLSTDSDNRNRKKSTESDPPTPKTPKIKKLPQITSFRTMKKQTIPERLKMGRCRTLS